MKSKRKATLKKKIGTKFGILTPQGIKKQMTIDLGEVKKHSSDPLAFAYGLFQAKSGQKMAKAVKGDKLAPEYVRGFQVGKGKDVLRKAQLKNKILLSTQYDSRKSFYGKAKVKEVNGSLVLQSYETDVAKITNGRVTVKGLYSATTTRHIKEFLRQHGKKAESSKQIMRDYGGTF